MSEEHWSSVPPVMCMAYGNENELHSIIILLDRITRGKHFLDEANSAELSSLCQVALKLKFVVRGVLRVLRSPPSLVNDSANKIKLK